jgi:hypothetical protein
MSSPDPGDFALAWVACGRGWRPVRGQRPVPEQDAADNRAAAENAGQPPERTDSLNACEAPVRPGLAAGRAALKQEPGAADAGQTGTAAIQAAAA